MKDLTIIIPVHEYNEIIKNALASIDEDSSVLIVTVQDAYEKVNSLVSNMQLKNNIEVLLNTGDSDFCSQVNLGVSNCNSKWFSILEFDDTFKPTWFKNVEKYINFNPEVSIFLPLTELVNPEGKFVSFTNEAAWATSFSNEIGFIDLDCLEDYFNFNLTGGVFNTDDWNEKGGLKSSMKISFWYEFMLRMTYNEKKIMVIPKIGYTHLIGRENSLMNQYQTTISPEEGEWWIKTAKNEYFFKKDRKKTYNPTEGEEKIDVQ